MISRSFPPLFISQSTHKGTPHETARTLKDSVVVSTPQENHLSLPAASQRAHLHGQVQRRVAVAAPGVGVGAVSQQHHGAVQAAPLHRNVQSHVGRAAAHIQLGAVLQQQPCHLCPAQTCRGHVKKR